MQADRLFTRYHRALDVLDEKFDRREVTYERARGLVGEVGREATAGLGAMVELVHGSAGLDADFVRERLEREAARLNPTEREALRRRLAIADETERRLAEESLYDLLAPASIDINTGQRLVRIDRHLTEYFLLQTLWVLMRLGFTSGHMGFYEHCAFRTDMVLDVWEDLPTSVLRAERNKRSHLSNVLSRNEVGSDPGRLHLPLEEFLLRARQRAQQWPHALLAVATHDHKRGEDVRARLAVLSGMAAEWAAALADR